MRGYRTRAAAAAGVLLLCGGLAAGCSTRTDTNHQYFEFDKHKLRIETDSDLRVVSSGDDPLHVKQVLKNKGDQKVKPVIRLRHGVLRLEANCPKGGVALPCDGYYTVALPQDVDLTVRSDQEPITVNGVKSDLDLETRNQRITVRHTGAGRKLRMVSTNGWVRGLDLKADVVRASTTNKVLTLGFARPPKDVRGHVTNERATVSVPRGGPKYRVSAQADEGRECVEPPTGKSSPHHVLLRTKQGDARVLVSTRHTTRPAWSHGAINKRMPDGCLRDEEKAARAKAWH